MRVIFVFKYADGIYCMVLPHEVLHTENTHGLPLANQRNEKLNIVV